MDSQANALAPQRANARVAKEIRISVVMYGGVSLAIYMNGVTQELLHLVRSTARSSWDNDENTQFRFAEADPLKPFAPNCLKSTESVYRALARELNDPDLDDVRFIIDVISGTSAGGINGIFLAKALTDDSLSFDTLQSLWIEEGAIENLLNDKKTLKKTKLPVPDNPKSLLCSDRMYIKLLEALRTMKPDGTPSGDSLSEEIDLFATTTDINGRVIPLRLSDMLVWERKYKQDFHFKFRRPKRGQVDSKGDFNEKYNPFLAFVARCTSSFPFAFEPMQLSKVRELQQTEAWPSDLHVSDEDLKDWDDKFFDHSEQVSTGNNITRPFGDGGYLNNAPFSYVVDMLGRHSSTYPTDRKLIYVEPTPSHPELDAVDDRRESKNKNNVPSALANSYDALVKLPGSQPIHDDLQRVIERNRLVRKVMELSSAVTTKIYPSLQKASTDAGEGRCKGIDPDCVGDFSYLALRVYATTDSLSKVMGEWFGVVSSSSYYYGLRCMIRAWREANYEQGDDLAATYGDFLKKYDIDYVKRKYRFLRQQINIFYCFDQPAKEKLAKGFNIQISQEEKKNFQKTLIQLKKPFDDAHQIVSDALRAIRPGDHTPDNLKGKIDALKQATDDFTSHGKGGASEGGSRKATLDYVLGVEERKDNRDFNPLSADDDESYMERARRVATDAGVKSAMQEAADGLSQVIMQTMTAAEELVASRLEEIGHDLPATVGAQAALKIVKFFDLCFEQFDAAIFPLTYDTDAATPELISIVRVSPDDSPHLFKLTPRSQKLAGASLAHFGAFLDRSFRTNDILWGRLDGAERIIRSMLANSPKGGSDRAKELIDQAHEIIIGEFLDARRGELGMVLHEIAKSLQPSVAGEGAKAKAVRDCVINTLGTLPPQPIKQAIQGFLTVPVITQILREKPVAREPDRRTTLESSTRAIRIIGGMLEGLGNETKAAGGFIVRVATALWWLVEAAVPGGLTGHFFRKIFALLFWFEIVMVVAGTFFNHEMQSLGLKLLGITSVLWLVKDWFERYLLYGPHDKRGPRRTIVFGILMVLVFLAYLFVPWQCLWSGLTR